MPERAAEGHGFAVFDTAIGRCGVAWSSAGVTRVALPEASEPAIRARLAAARPGTVEAPAPPAVAQAIAWIVQHVAGRPAPLDAIALDFSAVSAFHREVYEAARRIPSGETVSYGALAAQLGRPGGARAIGQAMGKNPFPIVVPCHRVLAAHQAAGGFSAYGGVTTKARLLAAEGRTLALQVELPLAPRRGDPA